MSRSILRTDLEMLQMFEKDIKAFQEKHGSTPTTREYISMHPSIPLSTLYDRFGSYFHALAKIDVPQEVTSQMPILYSDDEIIAQYKELAKELGHAPTTSEYKEKGLVCLQTVYRRIGNIDQLRKKCGLKGNDEKVSKEDVLEDLKNIILELNRVPSVSEYKEKTKYNYSYVSRHFKGLRFAATLLAMDDKIPKKLLMT